MVVLCRSLTWEVICPGFRKIFTQSEPRPLRYSIDIDQRSKGPLHACVRRQAAHTHVGTQVHVRKLLISIAILPL